MKIIKPILLMITFLSVFSAVSLAQDEPIRVETNLVTVNVAVTDRSGNYVRNLKREDFEVWDGRAKQPIDTFSAEDVPVSFGIVYDLHSATDERTKVVLDALRQFTKDLKEKDNFFVTVFNERGSLTTDFIPTHEQISANLSDAAKTPNSLYDAIFAASGKVRQQRNTKQVLLVLTDGADDSSHHTLKELRTHLRSVNLPVYSVTFGNSGNQRFAGYYDLYRNQGRQTLGVTETSQLNTAALAEISKSSGGQNFDRAVQNRYLLFGVFKKVLGEVQSQYVLGFYPDAADGKWHKLKIKVIARTGKKYRLSNRKGYLSPKTAK